MRYGKATLRSSSWACLMLPSWNTLLATYVPVDVVIFLLIASCVCVTVWLIAQCDTVHATLARWAGHVGAQPVIQGLKRLLTMQLAEATNACCVWNRKCINSQYFFLHALVFCCYGAGSVRGAFSVARILLVP